MTTTATSGSVEKKYTAAVDLLSGGFGGALSKSLLAPVQRIVVLQQLGEHREKSIIQLVQHVRREGDGLKAFWRGNLTSVAHRFPYSGIQLFVYGKTKHYFQDLFGLSDSADTVNNMTAKFVTKGVAGGFAASVSGAALYPMEVVRNRLMSGNVKFRTISGTVSAIWEETNGPSRFYKGLCASLVQRVPDILINFAVYESVRYHLAAKEWNKQLSVFAGSAAAALCSIAVTFPIDVCKKRISLAGTGTDKRIYSGLRQIAAGILREEGLLAFYRGAPLEAARCIPQVTLMWFTIEWFRDLFERVL